MAAREHGAGQKVDDLDSVEAVAHPSELRPADDAENPSAEHDERHRRVMASAQRVMRKHRRVFAVLAK